MRRTLILILALGLAGCAVGRRVEPYDPEKSFFRHSRASKDQDDAQPAPIPATAPPPARVAAAPPPPAPRPEAPVATARAPEPPPAPPALAAAGPAPEPGPVATAPPPPRPAPTPISPPASAATSQPAPAQPSSGPIATNSRAVNADALDEEGAPDAPAPPPPPPDPALFAQALAPSSSDYGRTQRIETPLNPSEARARLQDRLTALNFPPPNSESDGFGGGPMLKNPGGFAAEADCTNAEAGGRPVMQAAWLRVRVKPRGRGSTVEISARFEEVRESPVRGVLARVACRSTGRFEADLLATLR